MRRPLQAALLALPAACSAATPWTARPPLPPLALHCLTSTAGSLCERSLEECRQARHDLGRVNRSIRDSASDCAPAREAVCFTHLAHPSSPGQDWHSARLRGTGAWLYECAATQDDCERGRESVVGDRTRAGEPADDVSPCEPTAAPG